MDFNEFVKDLSHIINAHSVDNYLNTPDFILADYLMKSINNLKTTLEQADKWRK